MVWVGLVLEIVPVRLGIEACKDCTTAIEVMAPRGNPLASDTKEEAVEFLALTNVGYRDYHPV